MGGAGAIRSVLKSAAWGVNGPKRTVMGGRIVPKSIPAAVHAVSGEETQAAIYTSFHESRSDSSRADERGWVYDDWEFDGNDEGDLFDSIDPPPRLVFGSVPTIEEAKEATSNLKEAIEKVYFSLPETPGESFESIHSTADNSSSTACVTSENVMVLPSASKPVLHAFRLLKENPELQNVVSSLVSDKKVWEAVMQNEKLKEFYPSVIDSSATDPTDTEESTDRSSKEKPNGGFMRIVDDIRQKMLEMSTNISEWIVGYFGNSTEKSAYGHGDSSRTIGGVSLIGLVIMVIMVIIFKRV